MKLGALSVPYGAMSLKDTCKKYSELGLETIELGCGMYPGYAHCPVSDLLKDSNKRDEMMAVLDKYHIEISALSCHGNPIHPTQEIAQIGKTDLFQAIDLAVLLGVTTVITFSGCPGDSANSVYPNWVTCAWPDDYQKILDYQWEQVLIPFWKETMDYAKQRGIRVALEMHPGFCVYNPETMMRLRKATNEYLGANFDPSHLYWQGIEPIAAIRYLGDAIFHFHAKDCMIDVQNTKNNGCLDTKPYGQFGDRSWSFRSVGYGHSEKEWKDMISALRLAGYDGSISLEHEDGLMSVDEGVEKALHILKNVVVKQAPCEIWWA